MQGPDRLCNDVHILRRLIRPLLERVFKTSFNVLKLYDKPVFCCASLRFFLKTVFCCDMMFIFCLSKLIDEALNVHLWPLSRTTLGCWGVLGMSSFCGSQVSV